MINIIAEAREGQGFGHLARCGALRQTLKDIDVESRILPFTDQLASSLGTQDFPFTETGDILIIDSYILAESQINILKNALKASVVGVIVDDEVIPNHPDFVLSPVPISDLADDFRADQMDSNQQVFSGFILKNSLRIVKSGRRNSGNRLSNIGITLGGELVGSLLLQVLDWVADTLTQKKVRPIRCDIFFRKIFDQSDFDLPDLLKKRFSKRLIVNLIEDAPNYHASISESDLIVCSGGQSSIELIGLGIPVLVLQTEQNQKRQCRWLQRSGLWVSRINSLGSETQLLREFQPESNEIKDLLARQATFLERYTLRGRNAEKLWRQIDLLRMN